MTTTTDFIRDMRALCEKATPPPWKAIRGKPEPGEGCICDLLNGTVVIVEDTIKDDEFDAAFIATARTALPEALDRLERSEGDRRYLLKAVLKIERSGIFGCCPFCGAGWEGPDEGHAERCPVTMALREAKEEL